MKYVTVTVTVNIKGIVTIYGIVQLQTKTSMKSIKMSLVWFSNNRNGFGWQRIHEFDGFFFVTTENLMNEPILPPSHRLFFFLSLMLRLSIFFSHFFVVPFISLIIKAISAFKASKMKNKMLHIFFCSSLTVNYIVETTCLFRGFFFNSFGFLS